MGERKVLSKYYPPDFDPSQVPRLRRPKDKDKPVRFMLPMSVRCTHCGAFMGQGLKFNARKGNTDEDYLGIKIYRFTMRCKQCPESFSIKTDPKNSDYICESGVKRNYEPWREKEKLEMEAKAEREEADKDTMVALENKTADAKKEMEELDELDELKLLKSLQSTISPDDLLKRKRKAESDSKVEEEKNMEEMIRDEARRVFAAKRARTAPVSGKSQVPLVPSTQPGKSISAPSKLPFGVKVKPKKTLEKQDNESNSYPKESKDISSASKSPIVGGLLGYSSSDSE